MEEAKGDQIPRTLKKDDRLNTGGYKTLSMAERQEVRCERAIGRRLQTDRPLSTRRPARPGAAVEQRLPQESETGSSKDKKEAVSVIRTQSVP